MNEPRRVLCIGLDGATFDVLGPWMADGTLPNLARLKQNGVWGDLASTVPPLTAPAWLSFMTGKNPGAHGIFHFLDLSDDLARARGERRIVDLSGANSPALWDVLGHENRKVGVINVPMTYPPRPVNGFMLTGMMTPPDGSFAWPSDLISEVPDYRIDIDEFSGKRPFARDTDDEPGVANVDAVIAAYHDLMHQRSRIAKRFLDQSTWDFFMVVYTGTDRLGHYAWPYHQEPSGRDATALDYKRYHAVRDYYRELDEQIGALVDAAGPEAVTMVMSDHGMGPTWTRRVHLNDWLYRNGMLKLREGNGRVAKPDQWLMRLRIPRDRLARLVRALPLPKRAIRRAANASAAEIDMESSKAYYVHIYNHIGGVRIVTDDPDERSAIANRLLDQLPKMRDEESGRAIFRQVALREDLYAGAYTESMPDVVTIAHPQYAGSTRVSHRSRLVTERRETQIPGAHRDEGVFIAAGPGVANDPAPLEGLRIEDLAPTILHLLGAPVPEAMTGRVITELLQPEFASASTVSTVTGDGSGVWRGPNDIQGDEALQNGDDERLLEHLKALGYL